MKIYSACVGPIQTNCYLLCDEDADVCALIDPGDEPERLAAMVRQSGCALRYILLTHGHYDHYTAVRPLLRQFDVPVYIHASDVCDGDGGELRFPRLDEAHQRYYAEGDVLTLGTLSLRVLETPGHTPGSVCLLCGDVLFSGDTLFCMSCGRTDFPGGSYRQMLRSLARLAALEGDAQVLPGHEEATSLSFERAHNPYMKQGLKP